MKKLLATFAVCMAFSMPAMAYTIDEEHNAILNAAEITYGNDANGAARIQRLANELEQLALDGSYGSERWKTIIAAATNEGWIAIVNDVVGDTNITWTVPATLYGLVNGNFGAFVDPAIDDEITADFNLAFKKADNSITVASNSQALHQNTETFWYGKTTNRINGTNISISGKSSTLGNLDQRIAEIVDDAVEEAIEKAYNTGFDDGFEAGYKQGWRDAEDFHGIN